MQYRDILIIKLCNSYTNPPETPSSRPCTDRRIFGSLQGVPKKILQQNVFQQQPKKLKPHLYIFTQIKTKTIILHSTTVIITNLFTILITFYINLLK